MSKRRTRAFAVIGAIGGLLFGFFASQAAYAYGHIILANTTPSGDNLIDAVSSSGPATGAVVILAFVIKAWFADMKSNQADTKTAIEATLTAISKKIEDLSKDDSRLREEYIALKADNKDMSRRITRLERKFGSGTFKAAEDTE